MGAVQPAINSGAVPASLASSPSGIIGGGQIGFNSQRNRVVFGVEADWQGADISSSQSVSPAVAPFITTSATQKLDFLGTLRGRIGYLPIDPLLIYVTGGLAYGDVQMSSSLTSAGCAAVCAGTSTSSLQAGWALGVGAEWAVAPLWTAKIEYLHYDLGSVSQTINVGPGVFLAQNVHAQRKTPGTGPGVSSSRQLGNPHHMAKGARAESSSKFKVKSFELFRRNRRSSLQLLRYSGATLNFEL